jgi:hypothetical protein
MLLCFPHLLLKVIHEFFAISTRGLTSFGLIELLLKVSRPIFVLLGFPHLVLKLSEVLFAVSRVALA